ncbi:Aminoglycoside phosphotransferase [Cordyceps militaris CM01]|uniref:Aminoglycoside phosphotransferase n=1 Tax=Cordyceps militaris (strain CM01) TaxID=983644 RepID=G3JB83_CORMM|nr:Aminoglycoside phosphotransferase [Cordyceps militaris CM01]EGX95241.1 Aminoglycoside phosphotransferase [Cordyceps militaris CM01]
MTTRNLLSGPITFSSATARSANVLHALQYPLLKLAFYSYVEEHRAVLAEVIAHHLGTKPADIEIAPQEWWQHGSFNLVIPLNVNGDPAHSTVPHAILRFPLPYRVGEAANPGNADEKLNCEAATYAWLEENCPSVPIPKLYGFGLSTNQRFTNVSLLPWWSRWLHEARRLFRAAFGLQQPSQYVPHSSSRLAALDVSYLLLETVTSGQTLSHSWDEKRDDNACLQNLQGDLARIIVSLARVPLPRIGAFRLDSHGYLHLDNRPISVTTATHENEGLPLHLPRRTTFSNVEDFAFSQLAAFETRFFKQPNAIVDREDAWRQMASLAGAKLTFPQLFRDDLRNGPFVFSLTDLHRSNIFVDENWNITYIIDLEFACSLPVEYLQTPYWLDGAFIDQVTSTEFAPIHTEFMEHIRREEKLQQCQYPLSSIMEQSWDRGTFWVPLALRDPVSFTDLFYERILKGCFAFPDEELENGAYFRFCSRLYRRNLPSIIDQKLDDQKRYIERLTEAFADAAAESS